MSDPALDNSVCIFAREFLGICTSFRVWSTIGITFERDGRHRDNGRFRKSPVQIVVFGFAFGQADSPAIIMDYDGDVIRIIEGRCGAIESGIVEIPFWRSELPNELGKIATVFVVAGPAVFRGKIVLVPPCELSLRR